MSRRSSLGIGLLLLALSLAAQERLEFSADHTEFVFAEERERTRLNGNARVAGESFVITAEVIEIYGQNRRYVEATGGVEVYDQDNDIYLSSDELFYDRDLELILATGNAYMEDRGNNVVVKGGRIQNWDEKDLTEISVNVRIIGEDYTARGQFARYRRASETLDLSGTPEIRWKGDEYRATRILIDLANDELEFIGDFSGTAWTEGDDESAAEAGGGSGSGGSGSGE